MNSLTSNPRVEPAIEVARRAFREKFVLDANRNDAEQMAWIHGYASAVERYRPATEAAK